MKRLSYFVLVIAMFTACGDDFDSTDIENLLPTVAVESSVFGKILDVDGNPLAETEVFLAGKSKITNELGYFQFEDLQLNRYGNLLTAEKSGYIKGLRRMSVHDGTNNYIELMLLSDAPDFNFNSKDAATILEENGVKLTFSENSTTLLSGQDYNGVVNVAVNYIDPTSPNVNSILPGSLQGVSTEGSLNVLKSYSMINVELTNDQGEELIIKEGETVVVEFPIPESLLNNAPSEIPLWSLDEDSGLWIEEGRANLNGKVYVGQVSHFSYWNCDIPEDFVIIDGSACIRTNNRCIPLSYINIEILDANNEVRLISATDSYGKFTFFIPKDQEVTVLFQQICDDASHQLDIGPFTEDQDLGNIELVSDINEVQLEVFVSNCDGSLLKNGTLLINDQHYVPIINGLASQVITVCNTDDISVIAFNRDFSIGSELLFMSFANNITTTLDLCGEGLQEDLISVIATNNKTGEIFSDLFLDYEFRRCIEFDASSGPIFFSSLSRAASSAEGNSRSVFIELFHGNTCDTDPAEIDVTFASARISLDDGDYSLSMTNLEFDPVQEGEDHNGSITAYEISRFGSNNGDIVEGKLFGEGVRAFKVNSLGQAEIGELDDGIRYSVQIRFRETIEQ